MLGLGRALRHASALGSYQAWLVDLGVEGVGVEGVASDALASRDLRHHEAVGVEELLSHVGQAFVRRPWHPEEEEEVVVVEQSHERASGHVLG